VPNKPATGPEIDVLMAHLVADDNHPFRFPVTPHGIEYMSIIVLREDGLVFANPLQCHCYSDTGIKVGVCLHPMHEKASNGCQYIAHKCYSDCE
jgi:hypothetical protein